ncbi:MAG: germination protein YpeB [Firmicutes bacterium]|nr:germination protein YpeB [Bacillota bacterium]
MAEEEKRSGYAFERFTIPLLAIALVASLAWGYSQYRSRRGWEIRAENQYNRSFSELSTHVGELETQLGKIMVSNSRPYLVKSLTDIWRQAYLSQEDIGQLPLSNVELTRTKEFLAKVGAFSHSLAVRLNQAGEQESGPEEGITQYLSEKDRQTLKGLHQQARYLSEQLVNLQEEMLEAGEKWSRVDRLATTSMVTDVSKRLETNKITKGFMMMEDGFKRLPEPEMEGNLISFQPTPKGITGREVSMEQAREIAHDFIDKGTTRYQVTYDEQIKGDYPLYLFNIVPQNEAERQRRARNKPSIAVTVKGGHVAWMLKERDVEESKLSLEEAKEKAQTYLAERNYQGMTPVGAEEYRNIALVSLCPRVQQTIIYPEMIKVQVALDNGEVMGVETMPYLTFHDPNRQLSTPRFSEAEIRKRLNKDLKVEQIQPAVILNDRYQEVLTYECTGTLDQDRYRVYINATTGEEERIQRIDAHGVEIK